MEQRKYIDFLTAIEKLKCNTRHSFTSSGRHESVAEHSWRLAFTAPPVELGGLFRPPKIKGTVHIERFFFYVFFD